LAQAVRLYAIRRTSHDKSARDDCWHPISIDYTGHHGAQLIDLFVPPEYRSYRVVAGIYSGIRDQLKA